MAKLYYKYGAMGSSKTAQALIAKFNYEERNMRVWLIKPDIDDRDGKNLVRSRIGLEAECETISKDDDIYELFIKYHSDADVVISDECQFFTEAHIDQLRRIVDECNVAVMCYGLRGDFLAHLFTGSKRLFELADSIAEIKTVCSCGSKAIINARIDENNNIVTEGEQVLLGSNDRYIAMCHKCWKEKIKNQKEVK